MINDEVSHIEDYIAVPKFKASNCLISQGNTFHDDLSQVDNDAWVDLFEGQTIDEQSTKYTWAMRTNKFNGTKYGVLSQKALRLVEPRNQNFATQASFSINYICTNLPPAADLASFIMGQPTVAGTSPNRYWTVNGSKSPWIQWDPYTKKLSIGTETTRKWSTPAFAVSSARHLLTVQLQLMYNPADDEVLYRLVGNMDGVEEKIGDWAVLVDDNYDPIPMGQVFSDPYHLIITNSSVNWDGFQIYGLHWWVG
jgi:hypothetical protein